MSSLFFICPLSSKKRKSSVFNEKGEKKERGEEEKGRQDNDGMHEDTREEARVGDSRRAWHRLCRADPPGASLSPPQYPTLAQTQHIIERTRAAASSQRTERIKPRQTRTVLAHANDAPRQFPARPAYFWDRSDDLD